MEQLRLRRYFRRGHDAARAPPIAWRSITAERGDAGVHHGYRADLPRVTHTTKNSGDRLMALVVMAQPVAVFRSR